MESLARRPNGVDSEDMKAAMHYVLYCVGLDPDAFFDEQNAQDSTHDYKSRFLEGWISKVISMQPGTKATFSNYWPKYVHTCEGCALVCIAIGYMLMSFTVPTHVRYQGAHAWSHPWQ
jgi:hypothetical protein